MWRQTIPSASSKPSSTNWTWPPWAFRAWCRRRRPASLSSLNPAQDLLYGYLNRIPSSRRLERETQRNLELMWLTGRLMPDFKTIADFRRDNGPAIRAACAQFVVLCRRLNLFTQAVVALDGSKFKAVNNRDKNFTVAKVAKRIEQVEASIAPLSGGSGPRRPAGRRRDRGQDNPPQGEDRGPAPADAVPQGDGTAGGGCARPAGLSD